MQKALANKTARALISPRADLPGPIYSRVAEASTSTFSSTLSVAVELISRECAESSLFRLRLLSTRPAVRGSNVKERPKFYEI